MKSLTVAILGCGFTGTRVARRFLDRGARVLAAARDPRKLAGLGVEAMDLREVASELPQGCLVLHSVPPEGSKGLVDALGGKPARVVYLSSTGVYGAASAVDETTPVDPQDERARARIEEERAVLSGPWSALVLRPAAIYGPGRGIQERVRRGDAPTGGAFVSRIHVEDLAGHVEAAALLAAITGAYPVADEEPCTSREIAGFCARLMGVTLPANDVPLPRGANRRVNGAAIRKLLGITLRYPSYRQGIPAALAEGGR